MMLPLIVMSFLVFAVLLTVSSHPDRRRQFGTTTANVLAFAGSLMFVTILGQDASRSITFRILTPDPDAPEVMSDVVMLQRAWLAGIFMTIIVIVIAVILFAIAFLIVDGIRN